MERKTDGSKNLITTGIENEKKRNVSCVQENLKIGCHEHCAFIPNEHEFI
jgi:hypothetical protein